MLPSYGHRPRKYNRRSCFPASHRLAPQPNGARPVVCQGGQHVDCFSRLMDEPGPWMNLSLGSSPVQEFFRDRFLPAFIQERIRPKLNRHLDDLSGHTRFRACTHLFRGVETGVQLVAIRDVACVVSRDIASWGRVSPNVGFRKPGLSRNSSNQRGPSRASPSDEDAPPREDFFFEGCKAVSA